MMKVEIVETPTKQVPNRFGVHMARVEAELEAVIAKPARGEVSVSLTGAWIILYFFIAVLLFAVDVDYQTIALIFCAVALVTIECDLIRSAMRALRFRKLAIELARLGNRRALNPLLRVWRPQARWFDRKPDTEIIPLLEKEMELYLENPERMSAEFDSTRNRLLRTQIERHYGAPSLISTLFQYRGDFSEAEAYLLAVFVRALAISQNVADHILLEDIAAKPAILPNRRFVQETAQLMVQERRKGQRHYRFQKTPTGSDGTLTP